MSKVLYLDCGMGAAGDMLTAALMDLLSEKEQKEFLEELEKLQIPGVNYELSVGEKCGIKGSHMKVSVHGQEEESQDYHDHEHHHEHEHHHDHEHEHHHDHDHEHHHEHDHEHHHEHEHHHHHHEHHSYKDICHLVDHMQISDKVKADVKAVYGLIAEAESSVHNRSIDEIHFHEVGSMDAVADVTAVCLLMDKIGADAVLASPIHVGSGKVKCAHGILPVPAPATALILKNVPIYSGQIQGELCTPTGAALLKHFVKDFVPMPVMSVEGIGYGLGNKDFPVANCVRAMLGQTQTEDQETVAELCCNIDDMSGEEIGYAMEVLLREGALDVYTEAIGMKKNRPAVKLCVLCKLDDREKMVGLMYKHTSTIGIRESLLKRYTLKRKMETVESKWGPVQKKVSEGYGVKKEKFEFEDLKKIADENGISIEEVRKALVVESSKM